MSQNHVRLFSFTLVVMLYMCMVTSHSDSVSSVSNTTISGSDSTTSINIYRQQNASNVRTSDSPNTQAETSSNTVSMIQTNNTINDTDATSSTNKEITTKESTTQYSTTKESTTKEYITKGSTTAASQTDSGGRGAGIFFLIFIICIIFILAIVLYNLWKKGKRYSFDLTNSEHDTPLRSLEPTGTFEQTKGSTMNLEYIPEENPDKTNNVANGCSGEMPDQTPSSDQQNFPEEDSYSSDLSLSSPVKKVEFNLDLDLIGADPEMEKQTTDKTTDNGNENNNNDMNTENDSADLFTEINLDDVQ